MMYLDARPGEPTFIGPVLLAPRRSQAPPLRSSAAASATPRSKHRRSVRHPAAAPATPHYLPNIAIAATPHFLPSSSRALAARPMLHLYRRNLIQFKLPSPTG